MQDLPSHPAAPPAVAAFHNGLPLCTDCGVSAPTSLQSVSEGSIDGVHVSQTAAKTWSYLVLRIVLAACALFVVAITITSLFLWQRRTHSDDVAGEQPQPSEGALRGSTGRSHAIAVSTRGRHAGQATVRNPS